MTHAEPHTSNSSIKLGLSDKCFLACLGVISAFYVFMIVAMLVADAHYTDRESFTNAFASPDIQYSVQLSLVSCTITTILSLWVAIPIGYLMARIPAQRGTLWYYLRMAVDAILDIPIVLPPLVIGISLLIFFQTTLGKSVERAFASCFGTGITFEVPSVILAQFMVACAFAVRTMRATFEHLNPRQEQVALTLGCTRSQAFWRVVLPEAKKGILTAGTLAWARSLGEFGPILVFSGATRGRTEVLPTTVFLELTVGKIESAVAVSLLMVMAAVIVLVLVRFLGADPTQTETRTS